MGISHLEFHPFSNEEGHLPVTCPPDVVGLANTSQDSIAPLLGPCLASSISGREDMAPLGALWTPNSLLAS